MLIFTKRPIIKLQNLLEHFLNTNVDVWELSKDSNVKCVLAKNIGMKDVSFWVLPFKFRELLLILLKTV